MVQVFKCKIVSSHFKLWFTLFLSAPPHPKRLPQKDRPILLDDTGRAIYGDQSTNRPTLYSHQPEYILFFPPYPMYFFFRPGTSDCLPPFSQVERGRWEPGSCKCQGSCAELLQPPKSQDQHEGWLCLFWGSSFRV